MSVYLNGSSVLLDSGSVATSSGCCCGCNTCDDLPPTNPFGPPVHINIQLTLSGTCDTLTLSGTVTYDSDLSFALDGGLNYCAHNIGGGPPWSGHWTATCTLDGSTLDFGGGGAVAGLLRPVSDCTWWMFVSGFNESVNAGLCSSCSFVLDPVPFQMIAGAGDPSGTYMFSDTNNGVTMDVIITIS
jgi:hypothetical protein